MVARHPLILRTRTRAGVHLARVIFLWTALWATWWSGVANAADATTPVTARVAVAANFAAPMQQLVQAFEAAQPGYRVALSLGSTGALYAQIRNGAPFDVLLAADEQTPQQLEAQGLGVAGSRFVYATGRLVLWSAQPGLLANFSGASNDAADEAKDESLVQALARLPERKDLNKWALADPQLAPYGRAAEQVLKRVGVWSALRPRLVYGLNIAQAHQFVASGNASVGLVALSQVYAQGRLTSGSGWVVPARLHEPIAQAALLLSRGADNPAALAWLRFLRSAEADRTITAFGYTR